MNEAILPLFLAIAAFAALLMGFAIQQGATCAVIAVSELVDERKATRLLALLEASAWVAALLIFAFALGLIPSLPVGHAATYWAIAGGAIIGLGACINGACMMGLVARIGSGEWSYLLTPVGFYLGLLILIQAGLDQNISMTQPFSLSLTWPFLIFAGLFIAIRAFHYIRQFRHGLRYTLAHQATILIAISFAAMTVAAGAWTYTDMIQDFALGRMGAMSVQLLLFVMMLGGALIGGWFGGGFVRQRTTATGVVRRLTGGILIGFGSGLVPGGNDHLILVGMPFLWGYAWIGLISMCVAIALAIWLERLWLRRSAAGIAGP